MNTIRKVILFVSFVKFPSEFSQLLRALFLSPPYGSIIPQFTQIAKGNSPGYTKLFPKSYIFLHITYLNKVFYICAKLW